MNPVESHLLPVPGAELYYEIRDRAQGAPTLLLIAGGVTDAGAFSQAADILADRFRVVTYDPRGNSRSPLTGAAVDQLIEVHSDDAHRLLAAVTDAQALVFGSSSGAMVALDLLVRHPDQVSLAVAHEPPAVELLPDAATHRAFFANVYKTYQREGTEAAMTVFAGGTEMGEGDPAAADPGGPAGAGRPTGFDGLVFTPALLETFQRIERNDEFFVVHEVRQFGRYLPNIRALQPLSAKVVLAGGADSKNYLPYWPAVELSRLLKSTIAEFAGGHVGYMTHPVEFAARLTEVLVPAANSAAAAVAS
jgi:pimeloyl-ACP methyl ester carboxylesterase